MQSSASVCCHGDEYFLVLGEHQRRPNLFIPSTLGGGYEKIGDWAEHIVEEEEEEGGGGCRFAACSVSFSIW